MKINFEWQNKIAKTENNLSINQKEKPKKAISTTAFGAGNTEKENTLASYQEFISDAVECGGKVQDYVAAQRDKMTLLSNSMSPRDFHKMKEEGYRPEAMDPEEMVTILDTIKSELAKGGTHIEGYTDTISMETLTQITGNTGYAQAIVNQLQQADVPITEENIRQIAEAVDQALALQEPKEGNLSYLVSKQMEPTLANLYKAGYSSINTQNTSSYTGYASGEYTKTGGNQGYIRKTSVTKEDFAKIEEQIRERLEEAGIKPTAENIENGKWLLEKGIPVTADHLLLLQDIKSLEFPLDVTKVIRQSAEAIAEGRSPFEINLSCKEANIYEQAQDILDRYQKVSFRAADYTAFRKKELTLVRMEEYEVSVEITRENIQARKMLEEVRLKMTVEANIRLLKSGYSIDTAPMEELIKELDQAAWQWEVDVFGKSYEGKRASLYKEAVEKIQELPSLPAAVIGKFSYTSSFTINRVVEEGQILKQQFEAAKESYETLMTAPRGDLGDSIKKAFRNVDDILKDMGAEITEANQRAIRIMGYNQITITEDNLNRVKEADKKVQNIIQKMKPAITLEMIREGMNPLEMSMDEIQEYLNKKENDFLESTEKYSEFLYKLEKKGDITEKERSAYMGIYRMIRQIEKSDGAVIGSLLSQEASISFSNLLSAVRSKKARGTDIRVDDSLGALEKIIEKGASISDQIKAIEEIKADARLTSDFQKEQLKEFREVVKNTGKEKDILEYFHQPVTMDNLQSMNLLTRKRGQAFSKIVQLQSEEDWAVEEAEENILSHAKEFISSLEKREERNKKYDQIIKESKHVLEESIERREVNHLDLKELQSVYKQLTVAGNLSREESYEIPLKIGEEITSVNLTVTHSKQEEANVKITMDTKVYGQVEARFTLRENVLEGSVLTDYMDKKQDLQQREHQLTKAVEEALTETKISLKGIFFGVNEKLDINRLEKREENLSQDISVLYKVAKSFIRYISQEE